MCGIVGVWGPMPDPQAVVRQACQRIAHRGPDSNGYWEDSQVQLALGHVRLAIQDLSAAGHQPMVSACGRYVLVLNGEIYNHMDLRTRLEHEANAPAWRGHSDTETLLAAIAAWGLETALDRTVGMFALAVWDREKRCLMLARDRLGEKPLYLGYVQGAFVFASELKALACMPGFDAEPDRRALALLMRHNYIPAPLSIYRSIQKLMPGTYVCLADADRARGGLPEARPYWSAAEAAQQGHREPLSFGSDDAAVDALQDVLSLAVKGQMLADVPLGAFLSGGIDSSIVVALMQRQSAQPVNTFSIGFSEPAFNEAEHARQVAHHLGTHHTELYVSAQDALDEVPRLASIYDEPFADSSQIPTLLVTRMARQHVAVALSGDGGDELFGGYSRYFRALRWWTRRESLPPAFRRVAGQLVRASSLIAPDGATRDQLHKLEHALLTEGQGRFYQQFVSYWKDPALVVVGGTEPATTAFDHAASLPFFAHMGLLDATTYLPDDILVKVDRAAMSVSLETRVPMLDHRVFEFAQSLPMNYKVRGDQGKWLLRELLYRHVPRQMVDRPKKGFGVPLGSWLRGPLKDWAEALLDPARLRSESLFHADPVLSKWREHQSGRRDWSAHLWSVLMVQAWLQEQAGAKSAETT